MLSCDLTVATADTGLAVTWRNSRSDDIISLPRGLPRRSRSCLPAPGRWRACFYQPRPICHADRPSSSARSQPIVGQESGLGPQCASGRTRSSEYAPPGDRRPRKRRWPNFVGRASAGGSPVSGSTKPWHVRGPASGVPLPGIKAFSEDDVAPTFRAVTTPTTGVFWSLDARVTAGRLIVPAMTFGEKSNIGRLFTEPLGECESLGFLQPRSLSVPFHPRTGWERQPTGPSRSPHLKCRAGAGV